MIWGLLFKRIAKGGGIGIGCLVLVVLALALKVGLAAFIAWIAYLILGATIHPDPTVHYWVSFGIGAIVFLSN